MPATRAHLGTREPAINALHVLPVPLGFFFEHPNSHADGGIAQAAGKAVVLDHATQFQILDHDHVELGHEPRGQLVDRILSGIANLVVAASNGALAASYRPLNWLSLRPEAVEVEQAQALRAMLIEFGSDAGWRGQFGTMHRGEVLALQRPWWSVLSGGEGNAESMGIAGLSGPSRTQLESALSDRIEKGRYAGIWTEGPPPAWMRRALSHGYRLETRFDGDKRVLPLTGYLSVSGMYKPPTHSQYLFVRIAPPRVADTVAERRSLFVSPARA